MGKALDFILAEPWCIQPEALEQILAIAQRINGDPEAVEARLGRPLENTQTVETREGVAIIPVRGPIFRYANLFTRISGATSLEVLARDFTAADDDPATRAIVLNIDSTGGQATGISEFAEMIRSADKPVLGYIDGIGASAAYWIASAADAVAVSETALLGSIGTVATYRPSDDGEIRIISTQSPLKQATPDTELGRTEVQRVVNELTDVFIGAVARYRGTTPEAVTSDFGRGGLLVGAKAVAAGMADSLGSLESLIAGASGSTSMEAFTMSQDDKTKGPNVTAEWLRANHADVYDEIRSEAAQEAVTAETGRLHEEGANTERERIQGVLKQSIPGHEPLVQTLAFDGSTTIEQAAVQVLAAEKEVFAKAKQTLRDDEPKKVPSGSSEQGGTGEGSQVDQSLPVEERCKSEWEKSPELRSEFGELETYVAYARAEEQGKVRKLGGKAA